MQLEAVTTTIRVQSGDQHLSKESIDPEEPADITLPGDGFIKTIKAIYRTEGIHGFFKGWIPDVLTAPAVLLTAFLSVKYITGRLPSYPPSSARKIGILILARSITGFLLAVTLTPFDLLATRLRCSCGPRSVFQELDFLLHYLSPSILFSPALILPKFASLFVFGTGADAVRYIFTGLMPEEAVKCLLTFVAALLVYPFETLLQRRYARIAPLQKPTVRIGDDQLRSSASVLDLYRGCGTSLFGGSISFLFYMISGRIVTGVFRAKSRT